MDKTENKKSSISKTLCFEQTIQKEIGIEMIKTENINGFGF